MWKKADDKWRWGEFLCSAVLTQAAVRGGRWEVITVRIEEDCELWLDHFWSRITGGRSRRRRRPDKDGLNLNLVPVMWLKLCLTVFRNLIVMLITVHPFIFHFHLLLYAITGGSMLTTCARILNNSTHTFCFIHVLLLFCWNQGCTVYLAVFHFTWWSSRESLSGRLFFCMLEFISHIIIIIIK